jgi:hypothetical protein
VEARYPGDHITRRLTVRRVAIALACVLAGCGVFAGYAGPAWSPLMSRDSSEDSRPSIEEQVHSWPSAPSDSTYSCSFLLVTFAGPTWYDCEYDGVHITAIVKDGKVIGIQG